MNADVLSRYLLSSQDIVAVYHNAEKPTSFLVGSVTAYCDNYMILNLISPENTEDGIALVALKSIFRVEKQSQYLQTLNCSAVPRTASIRKRNLWLEFLNQAQVSNMVVQIADSEGKRILFGVINSFSDTMVNVTRVSQQGKIGKRYTISKEKAACITGKSQTELEIEAKMEGRENVPG